MPDPKIDPLEEVTVVGQPVLTMGHVASLPNDVFPDPADMLPLEVGHSTGITVNAGKNLGSGWRIWVRYPLVDGESCIIETHKKDPGGDWTLQSIDGADSRSVIRPPEPGRPTGPYAGFAITNQDLKTGTQFRINCTRVDSANWLYLAVAGGE